jgi:hypothetical protein
MVGSNDIAANVFGKHSKELRMINSKISMHYIFTNILNSVVNNRANFDYRWKILNLTYKLVILV